MPGRKLVALMIAVWVLALSAVRDFRAFLQDGGTALSIVNVVDAPPLPVIGKTADDSDRAHWETVPLIGLAVALCAAVLMALVLALNPVRSRAGISASLYCRLVAATGGTGLLSPPVVVA